jgi:hypothetical protein
MDYFRTSVEKNDTTHLDNRADVRPPLASDGAKVVIPLIGHQAA